MDDLARVNELAARVYGPAVRVTVEPEGRYYRSLIRRADGLVLDQHLSATYTAALGETLGHLRSIQRWQERTREAAEWQGKIT